ncbi:MAG: leucine-rich repeat domain-containing protein, partial [Oscillospiraceae bacterium]|nr:leucine-rich repeat domain-containing protein [Oscillospiraceae bacterium]
MKKLKRPISILLALILVLGLLPVMPMTAHAEENTTFPLTSGQTWTNTATNTMYTVSGQAGALTLTASVANASVNGGKASVGDYAFYARDLSGVKSVLIGEGVTEVGNYAFCTSNNEYTSLQLPASLITIKESAFYQQNAALTTVTIAAGSKLETIGECAFYCQGQSKLAGINLSVCAELRSVGETAFTAANGVPNFTGVLDLSGCTKLTTIGVAAFRDLGIASLRLPASLTSIDNYAFSGCGNLSTITIPEGSQLTSIGEQAFAYCRCASLVLPCANLSYIGRCAFAAAGLNRIYCLTTKSLTVDDTAFYQNADHVDVYMYASKKTAWTGARAVKGLFTVSAGEGVSQISSEPTWGNYYAEGEQLMASTDGLIENVVFSIGNTQLSAAAQGSNLYQITLPDNINADAVTMRAEGTRTISDAADWDCFCDMIEGGETFAGKTVTLTADVGTAANPVTRMAGTIEGSGITFQGVFDGGGHTLTFANTSADGAYIAPFRYVGGSSGAHACIHDLNVATTISSTGYRHFSGLIALTTGYVDVYGCSAVIDISCATPPEDTDLYPAGIVSQVSRDNDGTVTITGCTTTGTITTGGKYAGGIVGIVQGKATVGNCVSSVVIKSTVNGDGTHGGLVAVTATNSTTSINGCVFCGKLLTVGENDTGNCGGILGWKNGSVAIANCLYAPAALADGEREVVDGSGNYPSCTFCRGNPPTITNCYYTRTLGTPQAKQGYAVSAGEGVTIDYGTAANAYDVSGLTAYANNPGLRRGECYYAGENETVSLTLSSVAPTGYSCTGYQASAGTLTPGEGGAYTLAMPASDVTVTANYAAIDYNITLNYNTQHGEVYFLINTASGTTAHVGDSVDLYILPGTGYALDTLTVTDANGDPVPVTNNSF